ncbi:hypothetical protein Bca101_018700 [Brassica carinata]
MALDLSSSFSYREIAHDLWTQIHGSFFLRNGQMCSASKPSRLSVIKINGSGGILWKIDKVVDKFGGFSAS